MLTFELFDMKNCNKGKFYYFMGDVFSFNNNVRKELPYLDNNTERKWLLLFIKSDFIGFGSYEINNNNICKFKNDYIFPKFRKKGYFRSLFRRRMAIISNYEHIESILFKSTIISELYSVYDDYGFKIKSKYKNYFEVEKESFIRLNIVIIKKKEKQNKHVCISKEKILNMNTFSMIIKQNHNHSIDYLDKCIELYEDFIKDKKNKTKENNEKKKSLKRAFYNFRTHYLKKYPNIKIEKLKEVWKKNKKNIQTKFINEINENNNKKSKMK